MNSVVEAICYNSKAAPRHEAIIAEDGTVTYAQLWNYITAVAALLKRTGICKGDRVIIEASHTVEYVCCVYGCNLAGAVDVPVEKNVPSDRASEIAQTVGAKLKLLGKNPLAVLGTTLESLCPSVVEDISFPDPDALSEILFTTGTTGKSKGVMISNQGQMNIVETANESMAWLKDIRWLVPTPMNHTAGIRRTHFVMVKGGIVILVDGMRDLKKMFAAITECKANGLYLPPAAIHTILLLAPKALASLNQQLDIVISSSSAFPDTDKEKMCRLLPNVSLVNRYGSSEVAAVSSLDYNANKGKIGCVGKISSGTTILFYDEHHNEMRATKDNPGIIAIKSKTIMMGYWNDPELTANTISNGMLVTSDLGYIGDDGFLYITGRSGDVINIGGLKVAPTEVEDVALGLPMIADCACVPYDDRLLGKMIRLYVCLKDGYSFDQNEIVRLLSEKLETYKIPRKIEQIATIPRTYNGKIDRKKLTK